ncbi:MAG: hypothetical protein U0793_01940 [Gemmataceae bacterium]
MARIGSSLLVAGLFFTLSGCGGGGGGKSPEDAFNNMVEAAKKEDMRAFMSNLTKDSQNMMTGGSVAALVGLKQAAAFIPGGKVDPKEIEAILTKHGVNEGKAMESMKALGGAGKPSSADILAAMRTLSTSVKDGPAFVDDSLKALKKIGKGGEMNPAEQLKGAKISDVKVTGEKATAKVEMAGKSENLHFAKEDGSWRIDLIPLIEEKMGGK